jgi:hypothetical protein
MYKLHDIRQIQPQQNYQHKSLFIRQEVPKPTSSINEVQTKHRLLIWKTPINTSKLGQQQKTKAQNHKQLSSAIKQICSILEQQQTI